MANAQATSTDGPRIKPAEISGWPMLKIVYRTDSDRIADLLPPGITPGADPYVRINIYNTPVNGEPEHGVSTKVDADYQGIEGYYSLGLGIDQEAAIFISREINGQPKFPCSIRFYRLDDVVHARCTHHGYTFLDFRGRVCGVVPDVSGEHTENEWWIKVSRAVGGAEKSYDFAPHVVRVATTIDTTFAEELDATLDLADSPWDPYTDLLPMRELVSARLVVSNPKGREITLEGPLDPIAFWPYADTIGGSRWPGDRGGPRSAG